MGRSHQTIANWKHNVVWWEQAEAEAVTRWLCDVKDAARRAVTRQLNDGDGDLGLKVLERLDDDFAPTQRHVVTGGHGQPVQVQHSLVTALEAPIEEAYGTRNGHGHPSEESNRARE